MRRVNHMCELGLDLSDLAYLSNELDQSIETKIRELDQEMPELGARQYMSEVVQSFNEAPFAPLDDLWEEELRDHLLITAWSPASRRRFDRGFHARRTTAVWHHGVTITRSCGWSRSTPQRLTESCTSCHLGLRASSGWSPVNAAPACSSPASQYRNQAVM